MIFDLPAIIEFLSGNTTPPSTVIFTVTHEVGVAAKPVVRRLKPGDQAAIEIDRIGTRQFCGRGKVAHYPQHASRFPPDCVRLRSFFMNNLPSL
jgi:hypothetical protein